MSDVTPTPDEIVSEAAAHLCSVPGCTRTGAYTSHNGPMDDRDGCQCLCVMHFDEGWMRMSADVTPTPAEIDAAVTAISEAWDRDADIYATAGHVAARLLPLYRDRIRDQAYRDGESNREADFYIAYTDGGCEGVVALLRRLGAPIEDEVCTCWPMPNPSCPTHGREATDE